MNTIASNKTEYIYPEIQEIKLDNEISLALESTPPDTAPGEGSNSIKSPDFYRNDPYKNNA